MSVLGASESGVRTVVASLVAELQHFARPIPQRCTHRSNTLQHHSGILEDEAQTILDRCAHFSACSCTHAPRWRTAERVPAEQYTIGSLTPHSTILSRDSSTSLGEEKRVSHCSATRQVHRYGARPGTSGGATRRRRAPRVWTRFKQRADAPPDSSQGSST
jgi:hypothetical protein